MSTHRMSLMSGIGSFVLVALAMGCSSSTMTAGGTGGRSGGAMNSTGGTQGAGGAGSDLVGPGAGGATTGMGGNPAAASGGSVVVSTTAVDCNPPVKIYCAGTLPPAALISDFSIAAGDTTPVVFGTWGQSMFGGVYTYPGTDPACETGTVSAYPLTQTVTGGNWNIRGTVGTYSGLGLWWSCNMGTAVAPTYAGACTIDASAYTGISFTISGSLGPVSSGTGTLGLTMRVSTPSTTAPTTDSAGNPKNCGTCTAASCGSNIAVPVPATATTVTLTWAQLDVTTPNAIDGISFAFTDPFGLNGGYTTTPFTATPYPVDITIDDIQFTQ